MTATRADVADGAVQLADAFRELAETRARSRCAGSLELKDGRQRPARPRGPRSRAWDELAAAGATDVQLALLAFVRKPEQQDAFFAELKERWAAI